MSRRALRRSHHGLIAVVLCIVIYVVIPLVTLLVSVWWFGSPLPWVRTPAAARAGIGGWEGLAFRSEVTTHPIKIESADLVIRLAMTLVWVGLLSITALLVLEVRHGRRARIDVPRRSPPRRLAAFIAAGLIAIFAGPIPAVAASAGPSSESGVLSILRERDPHAAAILLADQMITAPVDHLRLHRIESGESLLTIAARYAMGRSIGDLAVEIVHLNRGQRMIDGTFFDNPALVAPGWILQIPSPPPSETGPPGPVYSVRPGDSWGSIAGTFLGDPSRWSEIWLINRGRDLGGGRRFDSPDDLTPGISLWLPAGASAPAPSSPVPSSPAPSTPSSSVPPSPAPTLPEIPAITGLPSIGQIIGGTIKKSPPPLTTDPGRDGSTGPPPENAEDGRDPEAESREPDRQTLPAPDGQPDDPAPSSDTGTGLGSLIGLGGATMLLAGVLVALGLRQRHRRAETDAPLRLPDAMQSMAHEPGEQRALSGEDRLIRLDLVLRAVGAVLADRDIAVVLVVVEESGRIMLRLTAPAEPSEPWQVEDDPAVWTLPGEITREELVSLGLGAPMPSIALVQLGIDTTGSEVYIDLEVVGTASVVSDCPRRSDAIVQAVATTLALSPFADKARLVGCDVPLSAFVGHRLATSVDEAVDLPRIAQHLSSPAFSRRARSHGGERWQPTVVFVCSTAVDRFGTHALETTPQHRLGHAALIGGEQPDTSLRIADQGEHWIASGPAIGEMQFEFTPIGLSQEEIETVAVLVDACWADSERSPEMLTMSSRRPETGTVAPVSMVVGLFGPVEVWTATGERVRFGKGKAVELLAWMITHRHRSTRNAARTALWDAAIKDSTFANVVSDARRSLARTLQPPEGTDWIDRTLTEELRLHTAIESDADIIARALESSYELEPTEAVAVLAPVVSLIRGLPFEGADYLWPDGEGITSSLVILGTTAARELAGKYLGLGDLAGVLRATELGLRILPGHEDLIELRLRAHGGSGDIAGARREWESHLRSISLDPWSDGRPAPRLQQVVDELIDTRYR